MLAIEMAGTLNLEPTSEPIGGVDTVYWLRDALAASPAHDQPPLGDSIDADVCIVGGGYTGLWTALHLKELAPDTRVVLLEAGICGGAASGRNGGFAMSMWSKFVKLAEVAGAEEAVRICRLGAEAIKALGTFCDREDVDAQFRADGWLWIASNAAQAEAWEETVDKIGAAVPDSPFEPVELDAARSRSGSRTVQGATFEHGPASVHPGKLVRGMRDAALRHGVEIFEHTPVTGVSTSDPSLVRTLQGRVRAPRVVLATHYGLAAIPELRRCAFVVSSDVLATVPIPDRLEALGLRDGVSISDSRLLPIYYRTTTDGRLVFGKSSGILAFGGRLTRSQMGPVSVHRRDILAGAMTRLYPGLSDATLANVWTGPADRSSNGLPFFGRLRAAPNISFGAGYSGNGVAPSNLGGRVLASLVLDRDDEYAAVAATLHPKPALPPEPFRFLGGRLVRDGVARKERAEDAGRTPDPVSRLAARLVPATFVPVREEGEQTSG
jgi:glycine/D-amino acid oxidase-like deaminating enzyme